MMKRILVPIDFSESSANTLKYAFSLSKYLNRKINLIHFYPKEDFLRKYDFGELSYQKGIYQKLKDFFEENCGSELEGTRFFATEGGVLESIIVISQSYELIVLTGNITSSSFERFLGKRSTTIASEANCPVLLVPPTATFESWEKIWHIQRKDDEPSLLSLYTEKLNINPAAVQKKSFEESSSPSGFWGIMVSYWNKEGNNNKLEKAIYEARQKEKIDLIMLFSHQQSSFQKFLNAAAKHAFFKNNIVVMVIPLKEE